jgi:small multidrug resistance pump
MSWVLLLGAIASEVTGTTALKESNGFTRLVPTIIVGVGYLLSVTLLALAVRHLQISIAYAIWSGVGTAIIAIVGRYVFDERLTSLKIAGILLVILGVVMLNLANSE